jgi:hypothetical protein
MIRPLGILIAMAALRDIRLLRKASERQKPDKAVDAE